MTRERAIQLIERLEREGYEAQLTEIQETIPATGDRSSRWPILRPRTLYSYGVVITSDIGVKV